MDTERVAGDRASAAVALLATAWVAVITVLDLVLPTSVVPDTLLALAPLIACSVLPPRVTAGFGLAAILLVVWSGGWNQNWNTVQQWIRLLDVVAVSTAAVLVAIVRVHREEHLMRLAAIAETVAARHPANRAGHPRRSSYRLPIPVGRTGCRRRRRPVRLQHVCGIRAVHRRRCPRQGVGCRRARCPGDPGIPSGRRGEDHPGRGGFLHERQPDPVPGGGGIRDRPPPRPHQSRHDHRR